MSVVWPFSSSHKLLRLPIFFFNVLLSFTIEYPVLKRKFVAFVITKNSIIILPMEKISLCYTVLMLGYFKCNEIDMHH